MLFIGIFIALGLFFYFQQKASDRNLEHFQKSREKFEQLIEQLKKNNEQNPDVNENDRDK